MVRINLVTQEVFGKPMKIREYLGLVQTFEDLFLSSLVILGVTTAFCLSLVVLS